MLTHLVAEISSQHMCASSYHVIHTKPTQYYMPIISQDTNKSGAKDKTVKESLCVCACTNTLLGIYNIYILYLWVVEMWIKTTWNTRLFSQMNWQRLKWR